MGLFDNLAKTVTVYFKVDGADTAKRDLNDIAGAARDVGDAATKDAVKLAALRLQMGALKKAGVDDFSAIARAARDIGDAATTSSAKLAALRLQLAAMRAPDQGGGGFFSKLLGGALGTGLGGALGGAGAGAGAGIPVIGGVLGAIGPVGGIAAAVGILSTGILGIIPLLAAAGMAVTAFGALAIPTFTRIIAASSLTGDRLRDLPVGMRHAAQGIQSLQTEFGKMAAQLRPDILKIFNEGLKIAGKLLPYLAPFAHAAAGAILTLLKGFDKFASSPGFKQFMSEMLKLAGPAIVAIGQGLGRVAIAFGKLLEAFINPNGIKALRILFDVVQWTVQGIAAAFRWATPIVIATFAGIAAQIREIIHVGGDVVNWFKGLPGMISRALSNLGSMLFSIGKSAIQGLLNGLKSIPVIGTVLGIAGNIVSTLKNALHIGSPSRVMYEIGVNISQGLINGLTSGTSAAAAAAQRIAAIITRRIQAAQAYAQQVSQSAIQFAGIAGAATGPAFSSFVPAHYNAQGNLVPASGTRPPSANFILRNLGADATRLSRFATAIRQLANRGLDADLISQIVAAGPDQGYQIAEALLHAPGAIQRADRIQNRINRSAAQLGANAAAAQFGGGNVTININGGMSTAHQIALEVEKVLRRLKRHRGVGNLGLG